MGSSSSFRATHPAAATGRSRIEWNRGVLESAPRNANEADCRRGCPSATVGAQQPVSTFSIHESAAPHSKMPRPMTAKSAVRSKRTTIRRSYAAGTRRAGFFAAGPQRFSAFIPGEPQHQRKGNVDSGTSNPGRCCSIHAVRIRVAPGGTFPGPAHHRGFVHQRLLAARAADRTVGAETGAPDPGVWQLAHHGAESLPRK